ncbi:threonine-phosphate decarboxylase CobD [Aureimonas altamirensis]|uniref:threonine-phosphate decarboxylase CobD n=1 Tax=Aureimonas altamirensis TaxID=370622 RepID=UPI00255580F9|nr:threonine-phosphate decarboxylase CobD [Aureimonas altamirensis]
MDAALKHGGALDAAIARWGGQRADWLDLSTGINPQPLPLPQLRPDAWTRLPEAADEATLADAARAFYGVAGSIVAAPGTQALIGLWPHLFAPRRAAILSPTYEEHRHALVLAGHDTVACAGLDDIPADASLVVVVNPNNPDGRRHDRPALLALAERLLERDGLLVVDEAFADADPACSLAGDTAGPLPILVLKSFGKYFGYAGLRLGFALCGGALAGRIAARLGPWAVSGPAMAVGAAALRAEAATGAVRARLEAQARMTRETLSTAGLTIAGGTAMFTLVRDEGAAAIFERLAARHILTRPFAYEPAWLRFGNIRDDIEAERLAGALCC